jgi:hypothetical protein
MKILPNPNASIEGKKEMSSSPTAGVISSIQFSNADFWKGLNSMFGVAENEELIGVILKDDGIQARIRIKG